MVLTNHSKEIRSNEICIGQELPEFPLRPAGIIFLQGLQLRVLLERGY